MAYNQPIFHSRRDLHASLIVQILRGYPGCEVIPEFNHIPDDRTRLSVWLPDLGTMIRLRYQTGELQTERRSERYRLLHHGANDRGRYQFLNDVQWLERAIDGVNDARRGFALMLTNDHLYWNEGARPDTVDADFRIHEGKKLSGVLAWSDIASAGTKEGMQQPISLKGQYEMRWCDYSNLGLQQNSQFRYLAVEVGNWKK